MRLFLMTLAALLFASACNLNNQPATPTLPPPTSSTEEAATQAPSVTPVPGINATAGATRTPFGIIGNDSAPTSQSVIATSIFPTPASGESAEITRPASGASVSALPLYVSGIVHNLPEDRFILQVFDAEGQSLTSAQTITLSNPNHIADVPWSASMQVRDYTGAAQIRITARTVSGTDAVIGTANITIIAGSNPVLPSESTSGNTIASPANSSTASGDPLTVTGTAGGIADNQFTLMLLDTGGKVLNSQIITLSGAETNSVPWSASLGTGGYHGQVEIRTVTISNGQQNTIASVTVNLQ